MTQQTTAISFSQLDGSEDTSEMPSAHGSLLRDIADDPFQVQRVRESGPGEREDDSSLENPHYGRSTEPGKQPVDFVDLFPPRVGPQPFRSTFTALQEWEGYVLWVSDETFSARLIDLTDRRKNEDEEADFPLTDLSDSQRRELRPGAIFRWAIGYRRTRSGTKERVSKIVFRRLPAWTERELESNRRKAEEWASRLAGE
jgi:hypothetical protein